MSEVLCADGTPFLVNLHARSSLRITISEAYTLVESMERLIHVNDKMICILAMKGYDDVNDGELDMSEVMQRVRSDLRVRIREIELTIHADKLEQWRKAIQ